MEREVVEVCCIARLELEVFSKVAFITPFPYHISQLPKDDEVVEPVAFTLAIYQVHRL